MARRYHIDELLWLRGSPLVVRPPTLPPVDEWMGYGTLMIPPPPLKMTQAIGHHEADTFYF